LADDVKVIVGRDEQENGKLAGLAQGRIQIEPVDVMGPMTLVEGSPAEDQLRTCCALAARYCDHEGRTTVRMRITADGTEQILDVTPIPGDDPQLPMWRID
jgi:hypothetical protein